MQSSLMAKGVLVLLMIFSIVSWAIIVSKFRIYRQAKNEDSRFLETFTKTENLTHIYNFAKELRMSPLARIFLTGYRELYVFQEMAKEERKKRGEPPSTSGESVTPRDLKGISLALNKAINREIERMSRRLEFLATTGSTTPFIGLFGTVWGIMHSFRSIGLQGTASIGGVAPGIAEALIATAAGLVAAIPAVIFFNYFNNKIILFTSVMDDFLQDFIYMAEKNFLREPAKERTFDLS
ncbi:MAG: Tol-Pal system subunit TolQ [Nitrospina sp.]|nr:Tol-Pal system subunit TolQ [Nitrospina sp.]MBT5349313.1 Tol-Pal system subunit TolQ [Nitrospina sp.]MBT5651124.1 Tol-Pal system subunit TolQ [Nitrospina sp.]MBT6248495.1 Tol-Pal system subunit TolQ [Nitrospina sp.]MBT6900768.1 Tol-Pal system subunit TolQ [Nitrospina sp.]